MSGHSKWANIKNRKAKVDEKRGKLFTKLGREILMAVRAGGGDPESNPRLKMAIQKARDSNMPMDNIQRLIQRASGEAAAENYEELVYEGYGPGGVAIMLNIATDNRNRTAAEIRHIFSRNGGNLGEAGCVAWMFEQKGSLTVDPASAPGGAEEVALQAIEAGAEDVRVDDEAVEVITAPGDLQEVRRRLEEAGFRVPEADVSMLPKTTMEIGDVNLARQVLRLLDALEDHDDVQAAFANFELAPAVAEELAND